MRTKWAFIAVIITDNKEFGKALAKMSAPFPDDPGAEDGAFDDSYILEPEAYVMQTPATQSFIDVLDALIEGADYEDPRLDYLKEEGRGLSRSVWGQAKTQLKAAYYRLWQEDGTQTPQANFMEDFLTAEGYTYTLPPEVGP